VRPGALGQVRRALLGGDHQVGAQRGQVPFECAFEPLLCDGFAGDPAPPVADGRRLRLLVALDPVAVQEGAHLDQVAFPVPGGASCEPR